MPTVENDGSRSLLTFYNYVSAWQMALESRYGLHIKAPKALVYEQKTLSAFKKLKISTQCTDNLASSYRRGMLTLKSMQLPVFDFPDLAPSANLWLPVQAYYAIHGMGIAVLIALGYSIPSNHRKFCAAFSASISRFLPYPFCSLCEDGPKMANFTFPGIKTSPAEIADLSNLAHPEPYTINTLIGKSLSTTRSKLLNEQFYQARHTNVRPGRKYRTLKLSDYENITQKLASTSIVDLLYRMRLRSNYEDTDLYFAGFEDLDRATAHNRALTYVTNLLVIGMRSILCKRMTSNVMEILDSPLEGL